MRFIIKEWSLIDLYKRRNQINFPIYQRGEIWFEKKKELLIDSIFRGLDIPKLYLHKTDSKRWDCVDGHQRIQAIIGFFDGKFEYNNNTFEKLTIKEKEIFEKYKLTITEITETEISDEDIRELFIRLQLGLPVNSGEKLNAIKSNMNDFVKKLVKSEFIKNVSIPNRRSAKEQVCAQICNNSRYIKKDMFRNSKYEDLENLYRVYADFDLNSEEAKKIVLVLKKLDKIFSDKATELRNRASIVSIYLLTEEMIANKTIEGKEKLVRRFYLDFIKKIKQEVRLGLDAKNKWVINYQSYIIQGADSKTAIENRHKKLKEAFEYYLLNTKKIIGYSK